MSKVQKESLTQPDGFDDLITAVKIKTLRDTGVELTDEQAFELANKIVLEGALMLFSYLENTPTDFMTLSRLVDEELKNPGKDIPEIVEEHLINGKTVERCMIKL